MKILALITARGGSKRLPGKNIKILGGKPLVTWSIDLAKNISKICDILVSTDDVEIFNICYDAGALCPWLRPKELSSDSATSADTAIHALNWYEAERGAVDGLLLLQPTSPFRSLDTIHKGIELFEMNDRQTVLGVSPTHSHPAWTMKIQDGHLAPFLCGRTFVPRSQDLPLTYVLNGSFYLISPEMLRKNMSFMEQKALPLIMESQKESLDIDTIWDFKMAEAMLAIDDRDFD